MLPGKVAWQKQLSHGGRDRLYGGEGRKAEPNCWCLDFMDLIGVDFGTNRLRVAGLEAGGSVHVLSHRYAGKRLPFAIDFTTGCRIKSLKRTFDSEESCEPASFGRTALDLLGQIFTEVRHDCRSSVRENTRYVLAVPPCFSQRQRSTLRAAAVAAGLQPAKLVDDTAAALLASWDKLRDFEKVLVYSWGAGTFNAALYNLMGSRYQLISHEGDRKSGGDDVDSDLADLLLSQIPIKERANLRNAAVELGSNLTEVAEQAKRILDEGKPAKIPLGRVSKDGNGEDSVVSVSPTDYARFFSPAVGRTVELANKITRGAGIQPDGILMVGGMTLLSGVQTVLRQHFQTTLVQGTDDAVAVGAVLYGRRIPQTEWDYSKPQASSAGSTLSATPVKPPGDLAENARDNSPIHETPWLEDCLPLMRNADAEYRAGHLKESLAAFDDLVDTLNKFRGVLCCRVAGDLRAAGKNREALVLLRQANLRDRLNRFIAVDLAQTCYQEAVRLKGQKALQAAAQLAQEGISALRSLASPEKSYVTLLASLCHFQGVVLCDQGRIAEAVPLMDEAVRLDRTNPNYSRNLEEVRGLLRRIGANEKCPCGSRLKYKKCCGRNR